jgi:hypothetical protein
MPHDITKLCADSLRALTLEKYGVKLKPTHAHELGAAFFGYPSKNAMLADTKYPVSNLRQAKIIVMAPDEFIDQRRKDLEGLSPELPNSYALGEGVYAALFSDQWWASSYPPFKSFDKLARFVIENSDAFKRAFQFYQNIPMHHIVDVKDTENDVVLTVFHSHQTTEGEMLHNGTTTIKLPRVAGHIGYGQPEVSVEIRTGKARQPLDFLGERQ